MLNISISTTDNGGYLLNWSVGGQGGGWMAMFDSPQPHAQNKTGTEVYTSIGTLLQRVGQLLEREHEPGRA